MIRDFLIEFKDGLFDSIQGFLVLRKLDKPPKNAAETTEPRASSVEPHTKQTVLEKRRMQKKKHDKKSIPSSLPVPNKVSAVRRVFWIVGLNIATIVALHIFFRITEFLVPNKGSNLYAFLAYSRIMLILPIFIIIRVLSTFWFADVANAAFRHRDSNSRSSASIDISRAASDFLHSIVVELIFLLQALFFANMPKFLFASAVVSYFGWFLSLLYMSLLHSLYSFEYMWMSKGISMHSRLSHVERHWPYHLGYGTILTILTSLSENFFFNSCAFGALFPFFIISSFLVDTPEYPDSKVGTFSFFYPSLFITNKISLAFYKTVSPEIKNR